jgi:hypothetical protein
MALRFGVVAIIGLLYSLANKWSQLSSLQVTIQLAVIAAVIAGILWSRRDAMPWKVEVIRFRGQLGYAVSCRPFFVLPSSLKEKIGCGRC